MKNNNDAKDKGAPKNIFRKASLERLSSPEELDTLVEIIDIKWWIALFTVGGLVAAFLIWSVFGSISTNVFGEGIMMRQAGVFEISSLGEGIIESFNVNVGDEVKKGQIIGRISQTALMNEIENNKKILVHIESQYREAKSMYDKEQKLLEHGIISELQFSEIKDKLLSKQIEVDSAKTKIESLSDQFEKNSNIISQYDGRIIEVDVERGGLVKSGAPVALVELESKKLQALLYFSPSEGKKIFAGMSVQVTPATVKQEEYGFIYGTVVSASEFPVTPQGLMIQLHNEGLVKSLLENGPPFEVYVDLITDSKAPSGYKWSSNIGPPIHIYSGTPCKAKVIVRKQRPLSLIIPLARRHVFGVGDEHRAKKEYEQRNR